ENEKRGTLHLCTCCLSSHYHHPSISARSGGLKPREYASPLRWSACATTCIAMPTGCATCTASRHRHRRQSRLIETGELEKAKRGLGETKKKCAKRRSMSSAA